MDYKTRHFEQQAPALPETGGASTTWRGWFIGLLACALLCAIAPVVEYHIRHTRLSLNLMPASSIFMVFALIIGVNLGLARFKSSLRLSRPDLALIFAMTMLVNPIPTNGFMTYLTVEQYGSFFYATTGNRWAELIHPHIPEALAARDPADPMSSDPRPVTWFFSGLPPGQAIPWTALAGPYILWCVAFSLLLGAFFCVSALLHRQWSEQQRLAFPLAQVPDLIMAGTGNGSSQGKSFFQNPLAWWGILLTMALHSWNAAHDYVDKIPVINLKSSISPYLSEGALRTLNPVYTVIYPSMIGIMFLISTEVSFSLWFFYIVVLKVGVLIAVTVFGLGNNGWYFSGLDGHRGIFTAQGTGAAFALVFVGFFFARGMMWRSIKQALGLEAVERTDDEMHPRTLWGGLLACIAGSVGWMVWAGINWYWALMAVLILLICCIAVARLISEAGVFWVQMSSHSADLISGFCTPVAMGSQNFVMLNVWSRGLAFDWLRTCPMTNIIGAVHLATLSGVKRKTMMWAMVAALTIALPLTFFSFYHAIYTLPGGAQSTGSSSWGFTRHPHNEFSRISGKVARMEAYEQKKAEYAAREAEIPDQEIPSVAKLDTVKIQWFFVGAGVMVLFMFLRTRIFWWPHPIGYVMWMAMWPMHRMWFSYFLGWCIKAAVLKYGGQRTFLHWRTFFIGVIVGEVLATVLWLLIAYITGHSDGYGMHYN